MGEDVHTVLVLGGYGFFGKRICAELVQDPAIRLLIGGRSSTKAIATARSLRLPAESGIELDAHRADLPNRLIELDVNTVIHTAGPFQDQDYSVARAAIEAGCHYVDLADGRQFVAGIGRLNDLAAARGVTVISGASSVPALSSAVVERYLPQFMNLTSIQLGISSGARAPGLATVKGIFGYCGKPFQRYEDSTWKSAYGWLGLLRYRFPSPLGSRWLSSCDIPDLELFPRRYPTTKTVTFHAGFASDLGHLVVWSISQLVRRGLLKSASGLAAPLNHLSRWIEPLVSDKGGMFVKLEGVGLDGTPKSLSWHLIAMQNHGPNIPCGASIALTQKLARGEPLPRGAMPCIGLLTVDEYLAPLMGLNIREIV
jgi:saccharopine dehydrogenase-like NADP-dependent oxidoreductase